MRLLIHPASSGSRALLWAMASVIPFSLVACGGDDGPAKQPNILVIIADDMGYSDIGAFGSEIATPNLDAIAREGRVLTNFHVGAACSPTRSMLMSGADHHKVGLGNLENNTRTLISGRNAPFGVTFDFGNVPPAYGGHLTDAALVMPQLLQDAGYHTYMAGKWHLAYQFSTPNPPTQPSPLNFLPAAFPSKKGFERSFALLDGAGAHFAPRAGKATRFDATTYTQDDVVMPASALPADYYSTKTFTDKLIEFIDSKRGDGKPFFAYAAYTAPHWPLQAPDEDIAAQAGRYDEGYEVIRARRIERMKTAGLIPAGFVSNPGLAAVTEGGIGKKRWSELTPAQRATQARTMEVYAAMVTNMDRHIGRLVQHLKDKGEYDNTIIVFMSDNGPDSNPPVAADPNADNSLANIGRPGSGVGYGERWAEVSAAPFRLWKNFAGAEGAVSAPLIVKLPGQQQSRPNLAAVTHVTDLLPTLLDFAGIARPNQSYQGRTITPISGVSLRSALEGSAGVPQVRPAGTVLAGEYNGMRFVSRDDWKLSLVMLPGDAPPSFASVPWRLYNITNDRGETVDLALTRPDLVTELTGQWNQYVQDNEVLVMTVPPPPKRDPNAL